MKFEKCNSKIYELLTEILKISKISGILKISKFQNLGNSVKN